MFGIQIFLVLKWSVFRSPLYLVFKWIIHVTKTTIHQLDYLQQFEYRTSPILSWSLYKPAHWETACGLRELKTLTLFSLAKTKLILLVCSTEKRVVKELVEYQP